MKRNKNIVTVTLMICSLALLIVLQIFWLQSSYEKAFYSLRRESGMIFRTTVMTLRDTAFMRSVEIFPTDSLPRSAEAVLTSDSAQRAFTFRTNRIKHPRDNDERGTVDIYTAISANDSISPDMLRPIAGRLQTIRGEMVAGVGKSFIIRLTTDTLNMDTLRLQYGEALANANIHVPFNIRHAVVPPEHDRHPGPFGFASDFETTREAEQRSENTMYANSLTLDAVRINPVSRYTASLANIRGVILAQITPQILFALFLTLLTATAFLVMFRNLRAQQRLMEAKNDFISNVTHELKTPVATVSVALEALRDFHAIDNPTLTQAYLDIAQHELSRLAQMTDKILETSVFETNGVDYRPESIDLDTTTQQIIASMKMVFETRGATIHYSKDGNNFVLRGGTIHITNVIYNLIDNALKYSPKCPVITVSLKNAVNSVSLSVKDEGLGIAAEYQKKIFEKFFRVPTGDVHNTKGYGLGLNYVASVIRSHGGRIDVQSEPGKGSCFIITLPRQGTRALTS
ncbi:HAMP domain-containing histidine kinase [Fulvivirgaceae bacterium PWU5]|uniref:histidine kinase n=1 Tax=Dawidia cretensis TaxID=2782350 RepID=A0AAP2GV80_9BACT|nr:HAMP domain-containing sensor histidine kinase [Dawidia cretensis]MBT1710040.1 HAMP domain-containing histidine kinase [Dawidia cretensis]